MARRQTIYEHVAQRLVRMRNDRGLTQEDLVGMTDIGESQLSKIESGARKLTLQRLEEIAVALGVPVSDFLVGYTPRAKGTAREAATVYGQADERTRLKELVTTLSSHDVRALLGVAERLSAAGDRGK